MPESVSRIEPTRLPHASPDLANVVAEITARAAVLDRALHPRTAAHLADLLRIMNTYYSNLIEGHNTRPRDIERALAGDLDADEGKRNLQREAAAHVRVQLEVDRMAAENRLPEPASTDFLRWLHREFYRDGSPKMLEVKSDTRTIKMVPGEWRSRPDHNVAVGRHIPPASEHVAEFMTYFEDRYRLEGLGTAEKILAMPAAHHRVNFIHPFPDGNGRVSRLMSHAMALKAGIGVHGLWSVSRGLARGLQRPSEYKQMMDHADLPRQGDLDGRGNLSERALEEFVLWFCKVCLNQITFMSSLFDLDGLAGRLRTLAERAPILKPEAALLLEEALRRGEFDRGNVQRITGLPVRSASRLLADVIAAGLLASDTPKGPVSLRFPADTLDQLFPRLYPQT
jgi:Fic family protein